MDPLTQGVVESLIQHNRNADKYHQWMNKKKKLMKI